MSGQGSLLDVDLPNGLRYRPDFISREEQAALADGISGLEFSTFEMRGIVARRRVAFFGRTYERGGAAAPLPPFLLPLRDKLADWAGIDAGAFEMALVNEYRPGTPIGWHRDAPQYETVAGISLLSSCRMKFRPYLRKPGRRRVGAQRRTSTHELVLEPRSVYLMTGQARNEYEHHIPAVSALRYSITFRTLR